MTLRRIERLVGHHGMKPPKDLDLGKKPTSKWVPPTDLYVDEIYQRRLGRASIHVIRKMVKGFKWRKAKWPICVMEDGKLHCIDGQHTAIAAAMLKLPEIPVIICMVQPQPSARIPLSLTTMIGLG